MAIQRCGEPGLSDLEGAARDAAPANDGFVASILRLAGLDWEVPDLGTLCRRQKTLNMNLPYRGGTDPVNLLIPSHGLQANHCRAVDSTGIKAEGEGEWNARITPLTHIRMCFWSKGGPKRRIWRKIQIGIDEETLEVRAVEVTTSNVGDAPTLPELLNQVPPGQKIGSVTADGAYDTRKCHDAIAARGALAVIPAAQERQTLEAHKPRRSHPKRGGACVQVSWQGIVAMKGRIPPPEPRRGETSRDHAVHDPADQRMHRVKLLGQRLMARDFDRQVAEIQIRIHAINKAVRNFPTTSKVD